MNMNYGKEITEEFQRKTLSDLLSQCTGPQQELFRKMYPNGPRNDQLAWAITQCQNTLEKNNKRLPSAEDLDAVENEKRIKERTDNNMNDPEIEALRQMRDEEIDISDIPEVTDWRGAVRRKFAGKPSKDNG